LVDATFIWTEPHSKRIKLKLTVQKEVMSGPVVVQTFPVEFIVHYQQCEDCQKSFTPHKWEACVQVRQKVDHKKTFHFLEQLILKHNAHAKVLNVKEMSDGLDFFFKGKPHAQRLIDFLQSVFPIKMKASKQLIGQDDNSNTYSYKYTFMVELPKVCRDDLVFLSPKIRKFFGGCSPILVCTKVASMIHFLDPYTMQIIEMSEQYYFQYEDEMTFFSLKANGKDFTVYDIEPVNPKTINSSFQTVPKTSVVNVNVGRNSDNQTFDIRTHLGDILKIGDIVLGFDLSTLNISGEVETEKAINNLPEVILVKKSFPERNKHKRIWKLKQLPKEDGEDTRKKKKEKNDNSFEEFLEDVEGNPELRAQMNLYRDEKNIKELQEQGKLGGKKNRKKVQAKGKKGRIPEGEKKEEEEKVEKKPDIEKEEDEQDKLFVRIEELLSDLTLNDTEVINTEVIPNEALNDFVSKLEKVKIDK